ncbi:MAG: hypothetical protein ACPL7J_10940, partial [Desulfomonilaceae bacterium]
WTMSLPIAAHSERSHDGRSAMPHTQTSGSPPRKGAKRSVRDDPQYKEIKKMIEDFPPEKMDLLKTYIQRWLRPQ